MVEMKSGFSPTTIALVDGQPFDFTNVTNFVPTPFVIAHGLSNICRFGGQCPLSYSVAEHSYNVSYIVPPEFALEALMHDAAEAFIGDVVTPLKKLLPTYKTIEAELTEYINYCYGLPRDLSPIVKTADIAAYYNEFEKLFGVLPPIEAERVKNTEPQHFFIQGWGAPYAKSMFLVRFEELTGFKDADYTERLAVLCTRYHNSRRAEQAAVA